MSIGIKKQNGFYHEATEDTVSYYSGDHDIFAVNDGEDIWRP